jgi:hypothetical protein
MAKIITFWSNWQRGHAALESDIAWLGEAGWTIPMWASPQLVNRLRNAPGDLDLAFVRYYTAQSGKNLTKVWQRLSASPGLRPWNHLLNQAIESYRDRRYAVVVPSLLLILEGAVASASMDLKKKCDPKASCARKRKSTAAGMRRLIWVSVEAFVKQVFGSAAFSDKRPIMLNRNWVLHGRDSTTWGHKRDCVRLFHALDTIATTVNLPR